MRQQSPVLNQPTGSQRLTFVGLDLARLPEAKSRLDELAAASGGRTVAVDDPKALREMLTQTVNGGAFVGRGSAGPPSLPSTVEQYAVLLVILNVLLAVAVVLLRTQRGRRVLAVARRLGSRRIGLLLVVACGLVPIVPVRAGNHQAFSAASSMTPTRARASAAASFAADPVVLVHGIFGSADSFGSIANELRTRGWTELPVMRFETGKTTPACVSEVLPSGNQLTSAQPTCTPWNMVAARERATPSSRRFVRVEFENNDALTFAQQGVLVQLAVRLVRQSTSSARVRLVGHSMGGLAARAYLQGGAYASDVSQLITVDTPHAGSLLPYFYRIYAGLVPDLGAPLTRSVFAGNLVASSFDDAAGVHLQLWLPAALNTDQGLNRLIGMKSLIRRFPTLHDPARRRESYVTVLRDLEFMPRVQRNPQAAASRFQMIAQQAGMTQDEAQTVLDAIESGGNALNKKYARGGTMSGKLRDALARTGRALNSASKQSSFNAMAVALADVQATTALSDVVAGAMLLNALASDEAYERMLALRSELVDHASPNIPNDPALALAFRDAEDEILAARSKVGAFAVAVNSSLAQVVDPTVSLGATLSATARALSAPSVMWTGAPLATSKVALSISDQAELLQNATVTATLSVNLAQRAGVDPALVAYAQLAFFESMSTAFSMGLSKFKDALDAAFFTGTASGDMAADYKQKSGQLRLIPMSTPCIPILNTRGMLSVLMGVMPALGMDPDAPSVQRLAPDGAELRAMNTGNGRDGYGALPPSVAYVSLVGSAQTAGSTPSCELGQAKPIVAEAAMLFESAIRRIGSGLYLTDPSTLASSASFFAFQSDMVVPVPSQSLRMVRVGWGLPLVEQVAVSANHLSVTSTPELLQMIDVPMSGVSGVLADEVLLVMDLSGSMDDAGKLVQAKAALHAAVEGAPSTTAFSLLGFSGACTTHVGAPVKHGQDRDNLRQVIDGLHAAGGTPLLDALERATEYVATSPAPERVAVVVVTDGEESCRRGAEDARNVARRLGMSLRIITGSAIH